jgi:hypothetical protein
MINPICPYRYVVYPEKKAKLITKVDKAEKVGDKKEQKKWRA